MAQIIELIIVCGTKGTGEKEDPVRIITELWTKDGTQVAEYDHHTMESWFQGNEVKTMEGEIKKMLNPSQAQK